ncbi:hypothetical protein SAMN02745126_04336, partial [Enhydrobacter aerosaccus]
MAEAARLGKGRLRQVTDDIPWTPLPRKGERNMKASTPFGLLSPARGERRG